MTRSRPITFLAGAAAVPLSALAVVGCGGGGYGDSAEPRRPRPPAHRAATIGAANEASLGTILVDPKGRTLYLFREDSGTKSTCFGACAAAWPPLRAAGKPTVGGGADAALVGTTTRSGRRATGHLQRPPALPLRRRPKAPATPEARA